MEYYDHNVTAVSPVDYGGVSGQIIQFNTGDVNQIHRINITQDEDCEIDPIELFFSNIVLDSGVQPIEVIRPLATVFINDTLEPECGKSHLTSIDIHTSYILLLCSGTRVFVYL